MYNIVDDISNITKVRKKILSSLNSVASDCIVDHIDDAVKQCEDIVECNIGIGTLTIDINEDCVNYYFKPSNSLERGVVSVVAYGEKDTLTRDLEDSLENKILSTYKELI